jgi:hypothetical protein
MRPLMDVETERVSLGENQFGHQSFEYRVKSKEWTGRYRGYGDFCSLGCCRTFANAAYRAGYRLKGKS